MVDLLGMPKTDVQGLSHITVHALKENFGRNRKVSGASIMRTTLETEARAIRKQLAALNIAIATLAVILDPS